jgi:hypothetical protein
VCLKLRRAQAVFGGGQSLNHIMSAMGKQECDEDYEDYDEAQTRSLAHGFVRQLFKMVNNGPPTMILVCRTRPSIYFPNVLSHRNSILAILGRSFPHMNPLYSLLLMMMIRSMANRIRSGTLARSQCRHIRTNVTDTVDSHWFHIRQVKQKLTHIFDFNCSGPPLETLSSLLQA